MRLEKASEEYARQVAVRWKSYALVMGRLESRPISAHSKNSRLSASQAEPDAIFLSWDESKPYISSSLPALEAAKCAQLQGADAFRAYHTALFRALFAESRDISDSEVLVEMAGETGLDVDQFRIDLESGRQKAVVIAEHLELLSEYREVVSGVPVVIVDGREPIIGAAPTEVFARVIERALEEQAYSGASSGVE